MARQREKHKVPDHLFDNSPTPTYDQLIFSNWIISEDIVDKDISRGTRASINKLNHDNIKRWSQYT